MIEVLMVIFKKWYWCSEDNSVIIKDVIFLMRKKNDKKKWFNVGFRCIDCKMSDW